MARCPYGPVSQRSKAARKVWGWKRKDTHTRPLPRNALFFGKDLQQRAHQQVRLPVGPLCTSVSPPNIPTSALGVARGREGTQAFCLTPCLSDPFLTGLSPSASFHCSEDAPLALTLTQKPISGSTWYYSLLHPHSCFS